MGMYAVVCKTKCIGKLFKGFQLGMWCLAEGPTFSVFAGRMDLIEYIRIAFAGQFWLVGLRLALHFDAVFIVRFYRIMHKPLTCNYPFAGLNVNEANRHASICWYPCGLVSHQHRLGAGRWARLEGR
jgi:hypothetical protein